MKFNAKSLTVAAFLGFATISFYACRKEISILMENETPSSSVKWAKDYFYQDLVKKTGNELDFSTYLSEAKLMSLRSQKKPNYKIPIWERAVPGKNSLYDFVEIPLKYTRKMTPLINRLVDGKAPFSAPNVDFLKATLDRFVIYKDKDSKINQRIITYVPTTEYLQRHNGDISHNRINKLDSDFDGYLVYRTWDDQYLFALIIEKGKAVRRIMLTGNDALISRKVAYRNEECEDFEIYAWFEDCTYVGDEPSPIYCSDPYSEYVETVRVCVPTGDDDTSPDGNCLDPQNFNAAQCAESGIEYFSKDECLERSKVNSRMDNPKNKTKAATVKTSGAATGKEYGFAMNLANWSASMDVFNDGQVLTDNSPDFVDIPFTWNRQEGYTIGAWHNHPTNGSITPDDIFWMVEQQSNPELKSAGVQAINYYRANVSVGVQTSTENYIATVNTWAYLEQLYNVYKADKEGFRDAWLQVATEYQNAHPSASWGDATSYATKYLFQNSVNLFKTGINTNSYQPLQVGTDNQIHVKNCPL